MARRRTEEMSVKNGFLAIALMSGLALAACSNTAAGVEEDARDNKAKADAATQRAVTPKRPAAKPPPTPAKPRAKPAARLPRLLRPST
jgi:hypothetical protein